MATRPVTAKPKMGSGESMECPPAKGIPASWQVCLLPSITALATSGGRVLMGQPKIAIAIKGVPPMA